jgi:hypothetical protein
MVLRGESMRSKDVLSFPLHSPRHPAPTPSPRTHIQLDTVLLLALAVGRGGGIRRHEALGDGGDELVALALHEVRGVDDLAAGRAKVRPRDLLRQRLRALLQLRLQANNKQGPVSLRFRSSFPQYISYHFRSYFSSQTL